MVGKILEPEIKSLIDARNFTALREVFREFPPADVAEVILDMPEDEQVIIFRVLPHDLAADVFEYLGIEEQQKLLRAMAHEQVVAILNEMSPDDRTALLEELPSAAARQLIRLLTPEERRVATALLGYPEDSVGRLMTPDFIAAKEDWTVQHVLDYVREYGRDRETLNFIYVVDDRGKLIDDVRMREFLLRPLTAKVSEIRDRNLCGVERDRFAAGCAERLPQVRSRRVAGSRFKRRAGRDRHERRHARRSRGRSDRRHPETRRHGSVGRAVHDHSVSADGKEARNLADHSVSRRNADRNCNAGLQQRDREGGHSCDVFALDHLQWRQFRIAGDDAGYPCDGSRRIASARLVSRRAQGITVRTCARLNSWNDRFLPNHAVAILAHFRLRKISLAGCTHCRLCACRGRALGNSEWRDAPLFAAPLRTRSGGLISTICRHVGRRNRTGNLFQCRAIRSSWDLAVIR